MLLVYTDLLGKEATMKIIGIYFSHVNGTALVSDTSGNNYEIDISRIKLVRNAE